MILESSACCRNPRHHDYTERSPLASDAADSGHVEGQTPGRKCCYRKLEAEWESLEEAAKKAP
jgi:hypothetical protein